LTNIPDKIIIDPKLKTLKEISDPNRLLILQYLSKEPQTPYGLPKKLRLRAPTAIHHLHAFRLAGLVHISFRVFEVKLYTVRGSMITDTFEALNNFLSIDNEG